jgi:hypothetical protein
MERSAVERFGAVPDFERDAVKPGHGIYWPL